MKLQFTNRCRGGFLGVFGITVEPQNIIGIRFNMHDWYIAFRAKYVSGEPISDGDEKAKNGF